MVRTTASWVDSFGQVSRLLGMTESSRVWVPGPLSGTMNLFAAVHTVSCGGSLVESADEATHAVLTPAALDRSLGMLPDGLHVLAAGDRLAAGLHDRAEDAGLTVSHYYGAAELSFVAWGSHADDLRPFPGVQVEARDGVLWARSPYLADGYLGEAGPFVTGPDGFGTVGDLGEMDTDRLVVHGRAGEAVTTAGVTVLVADVERALRPLARGEVLVVPRPHDSLGAVVAAVLTDPEDHPTLVQAARHRLTVVARPRMWFRAGELPVDQHGKTDRGALAELVATGALPRLTLP